ncbi:MAG TPA: DUF2793 domain-containing protein [Rhizomicrobium sp.]|nr:DUF2793 domain-containing protein [Rhizomicrobium sp.]
MTDTTPRTGAPLLAAAQAQKHVTHNEALYQFDAFLCARFLDRDLSAPPSSPADGDTYLVKAAGSGAWTGQDGNIAYCADGAWRFYAPFQGLAAFVADESRLVVFDGTAWVDYASLMVLQNVPLVGVNTTASAPNLLAVQSNAVLFTDVPTGSGGSGDVRATLSKQAAGNTASFLFQDAFSGRAEVGLAGDDNFHFKVSPDGSSWTDAIQIAAASGTATIASADINGGTIDGAAVGASTPSSGAFTTLTASAAAALSPANASVTLAPTGTGTVSIAPATAGALNNMVIGAATPLAATFTSFQSNAFKDNKSAAQTTVQTDVNGRLLVGPNGGFSTAINVGGNVGGFQIAGTNASANMSNIRFTASATSGGAMNLGHSRAAAIGSFGVLSAGDQLGVINFAGDDGASYSTVGAQIRGLAIAGGTISTGIVPGQLVFAAMNPSGTLTDLCKVDSNAGLTVSTQVSTPKVTSNAAGALDLATSGGTQFEVAHTASAVNYLQATGSASGAGTATLAAAGGDASIDIALSPKGSGAVRLGTVANGSVATALSSLGPTGAHTTVQEWFAVKNASGVVRYIPAF